MRKIVTKADYNTLSSNMEYVEVDILKANTLLDIIVSSFELDAKSDDDYLLSDTKERLCNMLYVVMDILDHSKKIINEVV